LGATKLVVSKEPKCAIEGDYWTDRRTTGTIVTSGHHRKCLDRYADALDAEYA
jgi:hypothetical protein